MTEAERSTIRVYLMARAQMIIERMRMNEAPEDRVAEMCEDWNNCYKFKRHAKAIATGHLYMHDGPGMEKEHSAEHEVDCMTIEMYLNGVKDRVIEDMREDESMETTLSEDCHEYNCIFKFYRHYKALVCHSMYMHESYTAVASVTSAAAAIVR